LSTSESKTSHSPSPTTPPTDPAIDPLQIPSLPTPPGLIHQDGVFPASATTSSLAELSPAGELATIDDYDDGFSDSVPFQALSLRINRSKGIIVLEGDAEERESVFLVPRGSQLSKSYYGMPYDPKTPHEASCASPDGKTGYGWIDADAQDDVHTRSCLNCQRRGFGAGTCDDLQTLLAYDVEKSTPVLVTFKNAEINQRRGVFTLAVNRMRTMGLKPTDCVFKLSLTRADGPYYSVQIDVKPIAGTVPDEQHAEISALLDSCWVAYKGAAAAAANALTS